MTLGGGFIYPYLMSWRCLLVNRFAIPRACLGNCLFKCICQSINVGYIIPVYCPGLSLLLRSRRFTIHNNTNTLAVWEEFLLDTSQIFPTDLNNFILLVALHQCCLFNRNSEWDRRNHA